MHEYLELSGGWFALMDNPHSERIANMDSGFDFSEGVINMEKC
jgi:hypothetical protein